MNRQLPQVSSSPGDEQLGRAGYARDRGNDVGLVYVLLLVFSSDRDYFIGLKKLRGPAFLHGKLTYPGGHIEEGESLEAASARELREETGVVVPEDAWRWVCRSPMVAVLAAYSDDVLNARQCDDEPVFVMNLSRQLEYAARTPHLYTDEFIILLQTAQSVLAKFTSDEAGMAI